MYVPQDPPLVLHLPNQIRFIFMYKYIYFYHQVDGGVQLQEECGIQYTRQLQLPSSVSG